jgi:dolichol-phosphate mannosyltransferase
LTPLSDPMTGFFSMTKTAYKRAKDVSDLGFKICLELYVKSGIKKHAEVSIVFGVRTAGESKLTGKVILHYLTHLRQLYAHVFGVFFYLFVLMILWFSFRAIKRTFFS